MWGGVGHRDTFSKGDDLQEMQKDRPLLPSSQYRPRRHPTGEEMIEEILPYLFYAAGSICFLIGTLLVIWRTL